jgi:hypothetical protein
MEIIVIAAVFLISLVSRMLLIRDDIIDFDSYGHIYISQEVRRQKVSPWGAIKLKVWKSNNFKHPFLWHKIVGMLPLEFVLRHNAKINGIIDSLFATIIFLIYLELWVDYKLAVMGWLLYITTPAWYTSFSIGTRNMSFTPRLQSEIFINISLYIIIISNLPDVLKIAISTLLTIIVLLSSKFGLQVVLFIFPLVSIISSNVLFIKVVVISFGVIILISRGKFIYVLIEQITHLWEYFHRNIQKKMPIADRNSFKLITRNNDGELDGKETIRKILYNNSYTCTFIKMPIFFVTLIIIFYELIDSKIIKINEVNSLILVGAIVFFIINKPILLFLGEAERYLNHIAIFLIIYLVQYNSKTDNYVLSYFLILYGIAFWVGEYLYKRFSKKDRQKEEDNKIVEEYLISKSESLVVGSIPYHNLCVFRIMLFTKHKVLMPVYFREKYRKLFQDKKFEIYNPFLNLSKVDEIKEYTGLSIIIIDIAAVSRTELINIKFNSNWVEKKLQQKTYKIYEFKSE